jgi:hypothetical protein
MSAAPDLRGLRGYVSYELEKLNKEDGSVGLQTRSPFIRTHKLTPASPAMPHQRPIAEIVNEVLLDLFEHIAAASAPTTQTPPPTP